VVSLGKELHKCSKTTKKAVQQTVQQKILVSLLPASKVSFDAALEETLRTISNDSKKKADLKVGRAVARAIT
jgi:hypothetical protein